MKWRFKNCVLGTYEIENAIHTDPSYINKVSDIFSYIDTSICYNNDLFINPILKRNRKLKVISKIPPQMTDQYEFMISNHLRCLGRKSIDIMLIHNPRSEWVKLARLLENDNRIKSTGVSNFTIEDLNKYKSEMGSYPEYNEIEINPEYYDKDTIEFCHDNGIKIIAYAIFGGKYNARRNISRYTLPFLLSLAGINAEFVIIRSDNVGRLLKEYSFLNSSKNEPPLNQSDYGIFDIESSNNKSIIPTEYNKPYVYSLELFPTNSDQVITGVTLSTGFIDSEEISDDLNLNNINLPKYEFVSDYRVYLRYKVDEILYSETRRYPQLRSYPFPSMYVASIYKGFPKKFIKGVICSFNLLDENGKLSKVDNGKCRYMIRSIVKNSL